MTQNFTSTKELVVKWAEERGITTHSDPRAQLLKAVSEMGELADAEIKGDAVGQIDGVGDVLVCLTIYCDMCGWDIEDCFNAAWEQIQHRRGRVVEGGAFVKEE
ncbi:MAG: hypothetical protein EBU08_14245 [Micrococcales bacterium]|nr:hypothetical protein [Micrococcales bacterium]